MNSIKQNLRLWELRWGIEPKNCIKKPVAWLWFIPLFIMFRIKRYDLNK